MSQTMSWWMSQMMSCWTFQAGSWLCTCYYRLSNTNRPVAYSKKCCPVQSGKGGYHGNMPNSRQTCRNRSWSWGLDRSGPSSKIRTVCCISSIRSRFLQYRLVKTWSRSQDPCRFYRPGPDSRYNLWLCSREQYLGNIVRNSRSGAKRRQMHLIMLATVILSMREAHS